jgi:hypothetical protein
MNYFIGMCKNHKEWITILSDLGYQVELVEQRVRTATDKISHPDVVARSNNLAHFLVCDCKGGITIEEDQINRYSTLTPQSFVNFTDPFQREFTLDVCITDIEENHFFIAPQAKGFPILTFGKNNLFKTGSFKQKDLELAFKDPKNIEGLSPPLSYYPFSIEDTNAYIAPYVIRGLVVIATKNAKGGASFADENVITQDEIIAQVFNSVYEALSTSIRRQLKDKIRMVLSWVLKDARMRETLELIEHPESVKVSRQLDKLCKASKEFIADLEAKKILDDFLDYSSFAK